MRTEISSTPTSKDIYLQSAKVIQRAWRRHIDLQVYKYYRDLINFKYSGDPYYMLKCINPKEASLLDSAAGTIVRFRLAGTKFPPNIYYKIFTRNNIVDMCANSPKDYTAVKSLPARESNNRTSYSAEVDDHSAWYKRIENNGWRLVSDRVLFHPHSDPVTYESRNKPVPFNHDKIRSFEEVKRKRKEKKIKWMQKLYNNGITNSNSKLSEKESEMIEETLEGMIKAVQVPGEDIVEDFEVDALLQWTNSLNYENYYSDWHSVGTTNYSGSSMHEKPPFVSLEPCQFTSKVRDSHTL